MTLTPYRLAPEIEEKNLDSHVSMSPRTILKMQRDGWTFTNVRNLPTASESPFYPTLVRLTFQRRKATPG